MEKSIRDLFIDELHDILSSEKQIVHALPEMVEAAESEELKEAFKSHLTETKKQVQRLEQIFRLLKIEATEKFCKGTRGLIQECHDIIKEFKKSPTRDAALISKAQRIEHYEISAYGTVRTFAKEMDLDKTIADLLQTTLDEEGGADKKLSKIAEGGLLRSGINHKANIATPMQSTHGVKAPRVKAAKKAVKRKAVAKKAKKTATKRVIKKAAVKRTIKRTVAKRAVKKAAVKRAVKKTAVKRAVKKAVKRKVVKHAVKKAAVKRTTKRLVVKGKALSVKRRSAAKRKIKSAAKRKAAAH